MSGDIVFLPQQTDGAFPSVPRDEARSGIKISNLSPELQFDLNKYGLSREGFISPADLELALCCLVNERKGRLAISTLDSRMKASMDSIDPDNNGYIDFKEIEEALVLYFNKMQHSRYKTIFWALFVITCVIFLGATFGLVYLVVDLRKDMSSVNNQLVSRTTGQPLQTASTEFVIQNGIMTQRTTAKQSRRDAAPGPSDVKLIPFSAPVSAISSKMTQKQISTLTELQVSYQPNGGAVSLAIDGFTLVPAPNLPGGKCVVFETAAGQLILNGTALSPPPKQLSMEELFALAFPMAAGNRLQGLMYRSHIPIAKQFAETDSSRSFNAETAYRAFLMIVSSPCHRAAAGVPAARRRLHQRLHQQLLRGPFQHGRPLRLGLRLP